jgi:hypothetical protein
MPWEKILDPMFLITMGLVLAAFAPLVIHIWLTWSSGGDQKQ